LVYIWYIFGLNLVYWL